MNVDVDIQLLKLNDDLFLFSVMFNDKNVSDWDFQWTHYHIGKIITFYDKEVTAHLADFRKRKDFMYLLEGNKSKINEIYVIMKMKYE